MSENGGSREECLYCHNHYLLVADRACPVCGAWRAEPEEERETQAARFLMEKFDPDFLPAYP